MKKVAFLIIILLTLGAISVKAQYTEDKLPSGLTVATDVDSADYVVLQKSGETYVKAAIAYKFYEYLLAQLGTVASLNLATLYVTGTAYLDSIVATYLNVSGQAEIDNVMANYLQVGTVNFDSIEGEDGRLISSNGAGWIDTIPALYEGDNAYSFGQRAGSVGSWSFITGFENTASGNYSFANGYNNSSVGFGSLSLGGINNISGGSYSGTLASKNSIVGGKGSLILGGDSDTITTDNNIILNSNSCSINTGEFNMINNSENVSVAGNDNIIFNCTYSDIVSKNSFIAQSFISQYIGTDSVNFVYGSAADTLDMYATNIMFTQINKGRLENSYMSYLTGQTFDTIQDSYLWNCDFYNDEADNIKEFIGFTSDDVRQDAEIINNFTTGSVGAWFRDAGQSIFGSYNDTTETVSKRILQVGNGIGEGNRSDAFCTYASGAIKSGGGIMVGDTANVAMETAIADTGMIANGGNELYQFDGSVWNKFYKSVSNPTEITGATYDLVLEDEILLVSYTSTAAVTSITLPTAQTTAGRKIVIKDSGGNATTNNITIDTEASQTIDGSATLVISTNYASVTLYCDGTNWHVLSDY